MPLMNQQKPIPTPLEAVAVIRDLQKRTGLTIKAIATQTRFIDMTIYSWSKGKSEPRYSDWLRFLEEAENLPDAARNGKNGKR